MSDLDAALLAAHEAGDAARLVTLYERAADDAGEAQARAFYLTHAYVFALEMGSAEAEGLRKRLIEMGAEAPV